MGKLNLLGFLSVARSFEQRLSWVLADPGLTLSQLRLLLIVKEHGRVTSSFLSKTLGITKASITAQLKDLQLARVVKFAPNPDDKRSSFVTLTSFGEKRLVLSLEAIKALEKQMSKEISANTIKTLNKLSSTTLTKK